MEIRPGTVIDKFEVVELLGQGAMASVYLVRHRHLDAPYALKVLNIHRPEVAERLLNEGRVQAALRHPNVVGVSDVILVNGQPGLVLEFVDGPTLETFIQDYGPLELDTIDSIVLSMCKGLRAAHRAGSLHRDLKPANILMDYLDEQWIPKIADFGLAKYVFGGEEVSVTRTGQIMGSPTFMSPEQCRDAKNVDERADVFALGAVVYELVTQQRCFDAPDVVSVFARIVSGAFVPVQDLRPDLPPRMIAAIHGSLVVDADHRIPDVDTFMAVWQGKLPFEANSMDVAQSVVALLGESASGTYATITVPKDTPAPTPPIARRSVRPGRVLGSLAALGFVGLMATLALLIGFGIVWVGGVWYQGDRPALQVTPPKTVGPPPEPARPSTPVPAVVPLRVGPGVPTPPDPVAPAVPVPGEPPKIVPPAPVLEPVEVPKPKPTVAPDVVPEPPLEAPTLFSFVQVSATLGGKADLQLCMSEARRAGVRLPSYVPARLLVGVDGRIEKVKLDTPGLVGGPLEECVRSALANVVFDPAPTTPSSLTYPLQ